MKSTENTPDYEEVLGDDEPTMDNMDEALAGVFDNVHVVSEEQENALRALSSNKSLEDENFGLTDEELELPPLRNPNSPMNFTDEEIQALTTTDDDDSIRLAFGKATPEEKALLGAPKAKDG